MPISRAGNRILGNDRPGSLSTALKTAYWRKHDESWHRTPLIGLYVVSDASASSVLRPRSSVRASG
jgi:hypothetical protein